MNLLTWLVTLFIALVPWLAINFYKKIYRQITISYFPNGWLLIVAALLYPVARLVPEPDFFNETRTALQHFIGGGILSFVYYLYAKRTLKWNLNILQEIPVVFAFVSSLGAINELLEFFATKIGLYTLNGSDVWYDIAANSLGAFIAYIAYLLAGVVLKYKN